MSDEVKEMPQKAVYVAPKLKQFGTVQKLTAAGSGTTGECGNNGANKYC